ncbi:MAG: MlaD family protein [Bacteroidota bacterium]
MKISREIKIGILAFAAILLFIWGLNYLKGKDILNRQVNFFAIYDDVTGLIESNPVSLNGVSIGQVDRISFMPDGSGRIIVECIVNQEVFIPENSTAVLTGMSLTGSREIIIQLGDSPASLSRGDTLESSQISSLQDEVSQLVTPIMQRADELFGQIDSVMVVFQSIFNQQTVVNLVSSFESIQQTLENLENTTTNLDNTIEGETTRISAIMANVESISTNLNNNNEALTNIINNFSSVSDSLAAANIQQTLTDAEQSLESLSTILNKIENGDGSLGLLVNDEELYNNLTNSSRQLELLMEDIRKNPGNYIRVSVFGR